MWWERSSFEIVWWSLGAWGMGRMMRRGEEFEFITRFFAGVRRGVKGDNLYWTGILFNQVICMDGHLGAIRFNKSLIWPEPLHTSLTSFTHAE